MTILRNRMILLLGLLLMLGGCRWGEETVFVPGDFNERNLSPYSPPTILTTTLSVGMVGDVLLHYPLYTYDPFDIAFAAVHEPLASIDFLLANQESLPGGPTFGYSGYPRFNSPAHIVRDLKAVGVDMLSIANNHILDQDERGLLLGIQNIEQYDMSYVGAYKSKEDRLLPRIMEIEGVRIGVLAYTYGTNGLTLPTAKQDIVAYFQPERAQQEVSDLKAQCDVVIVSLHWGNEYALTPSETQQEWAQLIASSGADIIFGHHPHVLQPYEYLGNTHVFYSLGNFYSAQQFDTTNMGGIARVMLKKREAAGKTHLAVGDAAFYPTAVVKNAEGRFVVVPLAEAQGSVSKDAEWVSNHLQLPAWSVEE